MSAGPVLEQPPVPPPPAGEVARIARQLRVVGWVMTVWAGLCMAVGCVFGWTQLVLFYILVLVMGRQALGVAAALRAQSAGREDGGAMRALGRGYVRQSWLVLA